MTAEKSIYVVMRLVSGAFFFVIYYNFISISNIFTAEVFKGTNIEL